MTNAPETLDPDALKVGLDAVGTLLRFRAYTPGPVLVKLLGRFRDDMREAHDMERLPAAERGDERLRLGELISVELDAIRGAVGILLQARFTGQMRDPALRAYLKGFQEALSDEKAERELIAAKLTADAKAS